MNQQFKKLAIKAGFDKHHVEHDTRIQEFVKLVHQAAMEEAAKICDELNYNGMNSLHCAAAIRNRSEEYLNNEQD